MCHQLQRDFRAISVESIISPYIAEKPIRISERDMSRKDSPFPIILYGSLIIVAAILGCRSNPSPLLEIASPEHEFGVVLLGEHEFVFRFINRSEHTRRIIGFAAT